MNKPRKSWREKMADAKDLPKVFEIETKDRKRLGEGTCVIAPPLEVEEVMQSIPKGKLVTINEIRAMLARKHGTSTACPITTGIFAWMAARAAVEAQSEGKSRYTAYWRTLKAGGEINAKYPGGIEAIAEKLREEGHTVVQRRKRWFVQDFENRLAKLSNAPREKAR